MPPSMRVFEEMKTEARKEYARLLAADKKTNKKMSEMQQSKALIEHIEFHQRANNVYGPHMKNMYNALDLGWSEEDCVRTNASGDRRKYLPLATLMARVEAAFVLDHEIIREAWVCVQAEAEKQHLLYSDAMSIGDV